jgi:NAD(P)-dependent dehydrogenase (short-subunit alcohol dehydrogenase family)
VRLAEAGADIIAVDICRQIEAVAAKLATPEDLDETVRLVQAEGRQVVAQMADVRDRATLRDAVAAGVSELGRLDVVVANAGTYLRKPATELAAADFEAAFAVNFWGAFHVVEAALPPLLAQGAGHLVLVTSFDARKPLPQDGAYAAAKAALAAYAATLRQSVRGRGVHVCTVFPGRVDTPLIAAIDVPAISRKIPAARVAKAVLRALRRRRAEVVVPWHCRLLLWADTLSPRCGDWLVRVLGLDGREHSP